MMAYKFIIFLLLGTWLPMASIASGHPTPKNIGDRPAVQRFIATMAQQHAFSATKLRRLFDQVKIQPQIIATISHPAESKPWFQYRPIFITPERIARGIAYAKQHAAVLQRAEKIYGVPGEIITAILGVETYYGQRQGHYRVIDSLATLAFTYPPRSRFFRSELEQFLLLAREEKTDPLSLRGSYAGAMGQAQFIASSYRRYAVDFNGDGRRNLWNDSADAIGSIASYLQRHGWQRGQPIAAQAIVRHHDYQRYLQQGIKPHIPVGELRRQGITLTRPLPDEQSVALIRLNNQRQPEFWAGLKNFYVITRYNHSPLYAMAVYQLSQAIRQEPVEPLP